MGGGAGAVIVGVEGATAYCLLSRSRPAHPTHGHDTNKVDGEILDDLDGDADDSIVN